MAEDLPGVGVLQSEIEKARDKLKGYNENIKKLTGRDPSGPGIRRLLSGDGSERPDDGDNFQPMGRGRGRGRLFGLARRNIIEDNGPAVKRRVGAFSRLGPAPVPMRRREREDSPYQEEELPHKLSVQSSVVSTSRETKNRKEIMEEQTNDKEGLQRNRRMFGLLLGTLNRFKTDSKTLQSKEEQRRKIDLKLEENAAREKRKFHQETKLLVEEMHLEQSKISRLQQKMDMVQEHAEREQEMKKLKNFIVTKAKPKIFWRPRQMTSSTDHQLRESKKVVDNMLQEGRDRLENEIKELMDRETKREERIKMRLREDGLMDEEGGENQEGDAGLKEDGQNRETMIDSSASRLIEQAEVDDEDSDEEEEQMPVRKVRRRVVVDTGDVQGSESGSDEGEDKTQNNGQGDWDSGVVKEEIEKSAIAGKSEQRIVREEESSSDTEDEVQDAKKSAVGNEKNTDSVDKEKEVSEVEDEVSVDQAEPPLDIRVVNRQDSRKSQENEEKEKRRKDSEEREKKRRESEEDGGRRRRNDRAASDDKDARRKSHDEASEDRKARKRRHGRDDSEEKDKRRRRRDSEEKEVKKRGDREENVDRDRSRRKKDDDRRKSRRDSSRDRERSRRDSRDRDRSKKDSKDSRSHHSKDKKRGDREEVVIKQEVEQKSVREEKGKKEDSRGPSEKRTAMMNLIGEEEDIDMESDQERS